MRSSACVLKSTLRGRARSRCCGGRKRGTRPLAATLAVPRCVISDARTTTHDKLGAAATLASSVSTADSSIARQSAATPYATLHDLCARAVCALSELSEWRDVRRRPPLQLPYGCHCKTGVGQFSKEVNSELSGWQFSQRRLRLMRNTRAQISSSGGRSVSV